MAKSRESVENPRRRCKACSAVKRRLIRYTGRLRCSTNSLGCQPPAFKGGNNLEVAMSFDTPCGASAAERQYQRRMEISAAHVMSINEARTRFIESRADEMFQGIDTFRSLLDEIAESSSADRMMIAMRAAVAASVEARRILEVFAKSRAAIEWEGVAPSADDSGDGDDRAHESAQFERLYGEAA